MSYFQPIKKDQINLIETGIGNGVNIRNDCRLGTWKINETPLTTKPISIVVLDTKTLKGNFYLDAETILWKEVWFVASPKEKEIPQNVICHTMVKTESLANFESAIIEAQINYQSMYDFIIECSFEKRSCTREDAKGQDYYVVNFSIRDRDKSEQDQVKMLKEYMESEPIFSSGTERIFKEIASQRKLIQEVTMDDETLMLPRPDNAESF